MGGTLFANSTIGAGTTFTVELQMDDGQVVPNDAELAAVTPETDVQDVQGTVLYIEDNLSNLRLVE